MKVEVIKGVKHSVELNFGEISVCITTADAENLIAQLRAVLPVPADVQEAADWYIGHRAEVGEDLETFAKRQAFADGMLAERWHVCGKNDAPDDYDPEYDKEALDAANEYVKGKQCLTYGAFRLMKPAFADGWMVCKERLMKDAVEGQYGEGDFGVPCINLDKHLELEMYQPVSVIIIKKEK